jgi:hypothetical protein
MKIEIIDLEGDCYPAGDFRSSECVELLRQSDIVVTNPPFSLFREFVAQLVAHDKDFLMIGNLNGVAYKNVIPLILSGRMRLGHNNGHKTYFVPDDYFGNCTTNKDGQKRANLGNTCWFTSLELTKQKHLIPLYKTYTPSEYPKYDDHDAIEVSKVSDIPVDYFGVMGVPITFLGKHNPNQFEIVGMGRFKIQGKEIFKRVVIQRKKKRFEKKV